MESFDVHIWERIAFHVLVRPEQHAGPPTGLTSILLISRDAYNALRLKNNTHLYARLFFFKFDLAAARRRLSPRWLTSICLAVELKKRMRCLKRIKYGRPGSDDKEALWACFIMMLENDERNQFQVYTYAHLTRYLQESIMAWQSDASAHAWLADTERASLILWLWWMSYPRDMLLREPPVLREFLISTVLRHLIAAHFRFPSVHFTDGRFSPSSMDAESDSDSDEDSDTSSDSDSDDDSPPHCSGPIPSPVQIRHYGHNLVICPPPITVAATLMYNVRLEICLGVFDPMKYSALPATRATAPPHYIGPTVEDFRRFHYLKIGAPTLKRDFRPGPTTYEEEVVLERSHNGDYQSDRGDDDDENGILPDYHVSYEGSRQYENDWYRLVSCSEHPMASTLAGRVYTLGSLSGDWAGRLMVLAFDGFNALVNAPNELARTSMIQPAALYWTLREHHCLHPNLPLSLGTDDFGGDDFLSAWIPKGANFEEIEGEDAILVYDPIIGKNCRYDTYLGGRRLAFDHGAGADATNTHANSPPNLPSASTSTAGARIGTNSNPNSTSNIRSTGQYHPPYSQSACDRLRVRTRRPVWKDVTENFNSRDSHGKQKVEPSSLAGNVSQAHGEDAENEPTVWDDYEDTLEHLDTAVSDILITGHYGDFSDVWGHFNLLGRVRPYDGRVVLLRIPGEQNTHFGTWIFSGYLYDQNLVGKWRETSTSANTIGWGGPFVVTKTASG